MSAKANLLIFMEKKNISKPEFYKKTGLSNGFLDKNDNISSQNLEIIISVFEEISPEWLITGKGEMLRKDIKPVEAIKVDSSLGKLGIPLIPISAMAGIFSGEITILEYDCERYIVPAFKDAEFLISVRGSSMQPKYNSGDIVACKRLPLDTFFQWNKVYVLDTDQGPLIKRVKKGTEEETITVFSDNPRYDPFELHRSQIYHIALVVGVIRLE